MPSSKSNIRRSLAPAQRARSTPFTPPTSRAKLLHAFTIIELLVVISIIALLIAILLPALGPARDSARRAACTVNMRSVGQAVELYKNQWKEKFPVAKYMPDPWLSGDPNPPLNIAMLDQLDRESPAWRCPGDRVIWRETFKDTSTTPVTEKIGGSSYTYVSALGDEFTGTDSNGRRRNFFAMYLRTQPTNTPIIYDFDGGTFDKQPGEGDPVTVSFFHRVRNVLFADGHAGRFDANTQ
ncbi:MAG: prepilin-type N-terminal cleavage/methylation domain-containing protein [Phycisphaeraceae bacterium]|nr:prepilin-type N-terminal cleavage/methylation domain-containing protein [Phycisphaeraceae bacterium]